MEPPPKPPDLPDDERDVDELLVDEPDVLRDETERPDEERFVEDVLPELPINGTRITVLFG